MAARAGSATVLGELIRAQRQMANLSLRQLSAMAKVSNPYLSQVERGMHAPSVRVLRAIAEALDVSAESLLVQAGLISTVSGVADDGATAAAIVADARLTPPQRRALLEVYRSYVDPGDEDTALPPHPSQARPGPTRRTSA